MTSAERRLAENEVVFRQMNERVQKGVDDLKAMAKEEGHDGLMQQDDIPLHFYCECSDEHCKQRIVLEPSVYDAVHKNRDQFIVAPGHTVPEIEHIVAANDSFVVVEKYLAAPDSATTLKPTDIDNTSK